MKKLEEVKAQTPKVLLVMVVVRGKRKKKRKEQREGDTSDVELLFSSKKINR